MPAHASNEVRQLANMQASQASAEPKAQTVAQLLRPQVASAAKQLMHPVDMVGSTDTASAAKQASGCALKAHYNATVLTLMSTMSALSQSSMRSYSLHCPWVMLDNRAMATPKRMV